MFSAPKLVKSQRVEVGGKLEIALELQCRVLAHGVMRREKGSEFDAGCRHLHIVCHSCAYCASLRTPYNGDVAQLAERYLCKVDVVGSIPIVSTFMTVSTALLISCPDTSGIVADVASWIATNGGNIVHAEQHTDHHDGIFFQRVEFTHSGVKSLESLSQSFDAIAQKFTMTFSFRALPWHPRTAILVSQPMHCLADMLTRSRYGDLGLDIAVVISNHDNNRQLVESFGYRFEYIPVEDGARSDQEQAVAKMLLALDIDLVILARYMLVLSPSLVEQWTGRMINIHHSFLPAFIGANPYRQAHDRGVKIIGATAHYVTSELDDGPIIEQDVAQVSHRDDVVELTRRGRDLETVVLARAVRAHVEHRVLIWGNRSIVFG